MTKPAISPAPTSPTLANQKSDFTAEGSPPPGKVSTSIPVGSTVSPTAPTPSTPAQGAIKRK